jgi:hypothetical protein
MADYPWIILAEVCKLKYSIKKLGGSIMHGIGEIWTLKRKLKGFFFKKHLMFCSLWSTFFVPQNARFQELPGGKAPWTPYGPQAGPRPNFLGTS